MSVTDADLAAAMGNDMEAQPEPGPETDSPPVLAGPEGDTEPVDAAPAPEPVAPAPSIPAEPDDAAVRSNLGRKVQSMSYELAHTKEQLQLALSRLDAMQTPAPEQQDDDDYDVPISKAELPKYLERFVSERDQKAAQQKQAYEKGVYQALVNCGVEHSDMPDDEYTAIADIALKDFVHKTHDPVINAEYNFNRAMGKFYRSRKPQNPLMNNGRVDVPLGGPSNTVIRSAPKQTIKLDKGAAELAAAFGWDDNKVSQVLGR